MKNEMNKVQKFGLFITKHANKIAACMVVAMMVSTAVFAEGDKAESVWNTLIDQIIKWVTRFGVLVMVVGGIMFGIGWQSEDGARKTSGLNVFVGGAIVTAVISLAKGLLA